MGHVLGTVRPGFFLPLKSLGPMVNRDWNQDHFKAGKIEGPRLKQSDRLEEKKHISRLLRKEIYLPQPAFYLGRNKTFPFILSLPSFELGLNHL